MKTFRKGPALYDILAFLNTAPGEQWLNKWISPDGDLRNSVFVRDADKMPREQGAGWARFTADVNEQLRRAPGMPPSRKLPMALVHALAKASTPDGQVALQEVRERFGEAGVSLISSLGKELIRFKRPELAINAKYAGGAPEDIRLVARSIRPGWARRRMPLLGIVSQLFGGPEKLKGWEMASLSHLFPTRPALYEELERNGLPKEKHLISGKGYSANLDVVYRMESDGWDVDASLKEAQTNPTGEGPEGARAIALLERLFHGIDPAHTDRKFLLLDDGAHLAVALHKHFPEHAKLCRVVEQTEHGILRIQQEILEGGKLLCPVINAAQSALKKLFEAPMIGEAIVYTMEAQMKEIHPKLGIHRGEAALLGFGAVNRSVSRALLRRNYTPESIWVFDPRPSALLAAQAAGLQVADRVEVLKHGFLTVCATGHQAMTPEDFDGLPDGAIVGNGGSGNHEAGMNLLELWDTDVAPLAGDRTFRRVITKADAGSEPEIVGYMRTAFEAFERQEAIIGEIPFQASVLGYDDEAKVAVDMLRARGFPKESIVVFDEDPALAAQAHRDGLRVVDKDSALRFGTILIGNYDNGPQGKPEMSLLKRGAVYVHHGPAANPTGTDFQEQAPQGIALSSEVERPLGSAAQYFVGYRGGTASRRAGDNFRHRVLHTGAGHDVLVLRSGYVVNMEIGIPPEYAQLILGMLQVAIFQATEETEPRLIDLAHQDTLQRAIERILKRLGRSLTEPSFEGLGPVF